MRQDDYPHPVSDPAAEGVPEYADDDSTADEEPRSGREAAGPDPAMLPAGRDEGPVAVEEFGTTPEEQRQGEPLTRRLSREEPDPATAASSGAAGAAAGPGTGADAADQVRLGDQSDVTERELVDDPAMRPHTSSQVSTYERIGDDPATQGSVGRLVQPDEGGRTDAEKDEIATDRGPSGGGAGAEELAMHEVGRDAGGEFAAPDEAEAPVREGRGAPEREPAPQEREPAPQEREPAPQEREPAPQEREPRR